MGFNAFFIWNQEQFLIQKWNIGRFNTLKYSILKLTMQYHLFILIIPKLCPFISFLLTCQIANFILIKLLIFTLAAQSYDVVGEVWNVSDELVEGVVGLAG